MLRIHFGAEDLARTRVVATYGPFAEALLSLRVVRHPQRSDDLFGGWRQQIHTSADRWARVLEHAVGSPPVIDLFTLMGRVSSSEEGSVALLSASRRALRTEIEAAVDYVSTGGPGQASPVLPASVFRLADDRVARAGLVAALREYCGEAVDPYWNRIRAHLDAEVATQARMLADGGIGLVLGTLHPRLRWRNSTLEVLESSLRLSESHLSGRGMVLVPSVFSRRVCMLWSTIEPDGPAVLFYPALRDTTAALRLWAPGRSRSDQQALASLLGTTRAKALDVIAGGCTTTELARRLGVSVATASHHATVLRRAGLASTRRHGSYVLHTVTPLGTVLLNGTL